MATLRPTRNYRLPSYAVRDGDAWVAECIPLGVASQGDSLVEALDLLAEGTDDTIANLVARGMDPLASGRPSEESIAQYASLQAQAHVEIDVLNVPDNVSFVVFDLLMPIPKQMAAIGSARPTKRYDGLAATLPLAC